MTPTLNFLEQLEHIISERRFASPDTSYTAALMAAGRQRIAQKVGEEGVELALASVAGERSKVVSETADLLYHVLVMLVSQEISLKDIVTELERRHHAGSG